ncbi:MAG: hypothetical protein AMXMBFR33_08590 [Candidatus Xenobia bacterium]
MSNSVSIEPAQAFRQMGRFALAEPGRYVVNLVAAAVASGATFCKVQSDSSECTVEFDGQPFSDAELEALFPACFQEDSSPRLRELAIGLFGALEIDPKGVTLETWGQNTGARLKLAKEAGAKVEKLSRSPFKDTGSLTRIKVGGKGFFSKLIKRSDTVNPEEATLTETSAHAPLKLTVNDKLISSPYNPTNCLLHTALEGPGKALVGEIGAKLQESRPARHCAGALVLKEEEGQEGPPLLIMVRGHALEVAVPALQQAGIQGLIAADRLRLSDDQSAIEPDEQYQELVTELTAQASSMLLSVISQLDKINELERVLAEWNLKKLARWLQDQGQLKEADTLYTQLLSQQEKKLGASHPDVAETVKTMFDFYKSQGREEQCRPLYGRMLGVLEASGQKTPDLVMALGAQLRDAVAHEEWEKVEKLAEKARPLAEQILGAKHAETAFVLSALASSYRRRYPGRHPKFRQSEPLLEQAMAIQESEPGPDLAATLLELADMCREQRRYHESEPLYEQALSLTEQGSDPLLRARVLEGVGAFYADQGLPDEAGAQYRQSLALWEARLGPEHPDVARRLLSLVELYRIYARYGEAEELYRKIVDIRTKAFGPAHRDLVPDLCNLALFYQAQGKHSEAEPLLSRAAEILESALGPDHVENAWVLNHLGKSYDEEGRFDEAEAFYKRALEICEKTLGADHPDLAVSLDCLVLHYRLQDRLEEAEPMARRALAIREGALGPDHPEVATTLCTLGEIYRGRERYERARPLYMKASDIRKRQLEGEAKLSDPKLGKSHYYAAIGEAAELQRKAEEPARTYKRFQEAEHLIRRATLLLEQTVGPSHPALCVGLERLADLYCSHRKFAGAEELLVRARSIREESLGPDHPDVIISLQRQVDLCRRQNLLAEAEPLALRWLEVAEQTYGPEHPETARALAALGTVYASLDMLEEAEPLHRRALEIRKAKLGPDHLESALSLAEFYAVRAEYQQAESVFNLVIASREDAPDLLPFLERYAAMLRRSERNDEAEALETQATIIRVSNGLDFPE